MGLAKSCDERVDAMRVRDFSVAWSKQRSTLIVAPFALHDARIADLSSVIA